jgi:hypothetical protein
MSVKEIRQLRTQIMMAALALSIRNDQTLVKPVGSIPPPPLTDRKSGRLETRSRFAPSYVKPIYRKRSDSGR